VAAWSKTWDFGLSLAGIVGSNPAGGTGYLSLVSVVCCQVEVCASGCSHVQRSPTEFVGCLSVIVKPRQGGSQDPLAAVAPWKKKEPLLTVRNYPRSSFDVK
jgi:hypothetical protein